MLLSPDNAIILSYYGRWLGSPEVPKIWVLRSPFLEAPFRVASPGGKRGQLWKGDNALAMVPDVLPIGLRQLGNKNLKVALAQKQEPPRITFPLNDTEVLLPPEGRPLQLRAEGGAQPYTWVIDGKPLSKQDVYQSVSWRPAGLGFSDIIVIDANGEKATVSIRVVGE